MDEDAALRIAASALIILANGFFVAAEYALIGCRKSRIEALAKRGNRAAKRVGRALKDISKYVAAIQIGITMCGILAGAVTEPFVTSSFTKLLGTTVNRTVGFALALIIVTFFMVVIGEFVPKYISLHRADRLILYLAPPLEWMVKALYPLIWLIESTGGAVLRIFGIKLADERTQALPKEELLLLINAQSAEGVLEEVHADMVSRALRLDKLTAGDLMVHRMDIDWLDADTQKEDLFKRLGEIRHTRVPLCRGDIDEVVGIIYLSDVIRKYEDPDFSLERIAKPAVAVPENLSIDRIIERMREERTQILIVVDEYGGTSGILTLEDVVEEIFGELEDRLETERPPIEVLPAGRVSAKADVRFDELVAKLGVELEEEPSTETLATILVEKLGRVPKLGDTVDTSLGILRIENMAKSRITRVSLQLSKEIQDRLQAASV
jgi:putative hemolysin